MKTIYKTSFSYFVNSQRLRTAWLQERAKLETLYVEGQVDRNYDDYHHPLWIKYLQSERNALENHPSWNHPSNQEEVPDSSDSSDNEDAKGGL